MIIVIDYAALVSGLAASAVKDGFEVIVPLSVVALIEESVRRKRAEGFVGLEELNKIKSLADAGKISLRYAGIFPKIPAREKADLDAREIARVESAVLLTADELQAKLAKLLGIDFIFLKPEKMPKLSIEKYFDAETMSVHIKENLEVFAKKGAPGNWRFEKITQKPLSRKEVEQIAMEIIEKAERAENAFVEIDKEGATVVQYGPYRIVITMPPFSKGIEITAVRPVKKLTLEDYKLPEELIKRFEERAEGILIAGPPGAGKTTFAQALAEFYASKGKIVKTIERPRDLNVSWLITQYGHLEGDPEATGEVLLLVRPDYTVYDELRTTRDFEVYADMRLAGVGMIGVTHASRAIDAIQRFLGRLDMGVIPQVIDTVVFIKEGKIRKVYELEMTVKVPTGMTEADLARPVVEVRDFFTKEVEFEIYAYGEETTIVPVKKMASKASPVEELAKKEIKRAIRQVLPEVPVEVEILGNKAAAVFVPEEAIPHLIGKKGRTVEALEKRLGIGIEVKPLEEAKAVGGEEGKAVSYEIAESRKNITFIFPKALRGRQIDFYVDGDYLFSGVVGRKGKIRVSKTSELGKRILAALEEGKEIEARLV